MSAAGNVNLVEVFSSVQGEGLYVGCRQVFVRLAGCNIFCEYCDTAESLACPVTAAIEKEPGRREFFKVQNPVASSDLNEFLLRLCRSPHHSVSVTGGEPLLQPQIIPYLRSVKESGVLLFLETNGTLPDQLDKVISAVDIVSMDIKLPSAAKGQEYWKSHADFLRIAVQKEVFVKIVLSDSTTEAEIVTAIELIAAVDPRIPLVFQPVSPRNQILPVDPLQVLLWQEAALRKLRDVRVIPQTHKIMGQM